MTAKEMFEKLGYKYTTHNLFGLVKNIFIYDENHKFATFWFGTNNNTLFGCNKDVVTIDEFKAIQKQIEELHWNE